MLSNNNTNLHLYSACLITKYIWVHYFNQPMKQFCEIFRDYGSCAQRRKCYSQEYMGNNPYKTIWLLLVFVRKHPEHMGNNESLGKYSRVQGCSGLMPLLLLIPSFPLSFLRCGSTSSRTSSDSLLKLKSKEGLSLQPCYLHLSHPTGLSSWSAFNTWCLHSSQLCFSNSCLLPEAKLHCRHLIPRA